LPDGAVKIADFGAAILAKNDETQLTGVGSPSYMSPEQVSNDTLSYQTDIYSLGVVMYKLLTGRLPFEADTNYGLTHKILNEDAPSVRTHRPALSARLADIVTKALRRNTTGAACQLARVHRGPVDHRRTGPAAGRPIPRPSASTC
jgi:serine/threonine protein kinase